MGRLTRCIRCRQSYEHVAGDLPSVCQTCQESDRNQYEKIREILKDNAGGLSPTELGGLVGIPATKVLQLMKAFSH